VGVELCGGLHTRPRRSSFDILAAVNFEQAIDLYGRLVTVDTTSSRSNLTAIDLLEEALDRPGIERRRFFSPDGQKANLFARLGPAGDASRAGLILSGHTDCVPANEPDWSVEPFRLTDRGDRWLGRGSSDMKGFVALAAALAAATDPRSLAHPLCLLFTYDEEVGMNGARELARQWDPDEPLPRACLIGEPTSLVAMRLHKGHMKLRVILHGRAAHSGTPHLGANAIEAAAPLIAALAGLRRELENEHPALSELFPEAPFVPLNVATIRGGVAINVVPDRCEVELGFRPMPGSDLDAFRRRVEARIREAAPAGASAEIELVGLSEPLLTAEESPLHRELCALSAQSASRGAPFATDGGPLAALGLESVVWGPGSIEVAHRADEWMPKHDFARCAELLPRLVERFCGAGAGQ
jgi:acetylornithine deacetylase